jgi:hypothetical protein
MKAIFPQTPELLYKMGQVSNHINRNLPYDIIAASLTKAADEEEKKHKVIQIHRISVSVLDGMDDKDCLHKEVGDIIEKLMEKFHDKCKTEKKEHPEQTKQSSINLLSLFNRKKKNVNNQSNVEADLGAQSSSDSKLLEHIGPYFRVVSLGDGQPEDLSSAADRLHLNNPESTKPDVPWLANREAMPNAETYWTSTGLKKYLDSGLYDWQRGLTKTDIAIMIAKRLKNPRYSDDYQMSVDPLENQPEDTYYIDRNREAPLSAKDLISRYSPKEVTEGKER